jgi:hypothetical protein
MSGVPPVDADAKRWMEQWRSAAVALARIRDREIAALTDAAALEAADTLLAIGARTPLPHRRVIWSGLIDLQRQLHRKR